MQSSTMFVPTPKRYRGTSLIEVLVVIVIFLVGILAIVQIFPRGFQVLLTSNRNTMATNLGRSEVERLKARTDQLAEMIVPVRLVGGAYVADPSFNPDSLGPMGTAVAQDGTLRDGSTVVGNWQYFSGPNNVRRVIGEGGRVPAPRQVGGSASWYGGVMVVQLGPIAYNADFNNVSAYGNDLVAHLRPERELERWTDGEFFVQSPDTNAITLRLPSGPGVRAYRAAFSAYTAAGTKRDYVDLPLIFVPASSVDPMTGQHPLYSVQIETYTVGADKWVPDNIASVDTNTLRVQRAYRQLDLSDSFTNDPYEYKLIDNAVGVLLFNPIASSVYVNKPHGREPLLAKVNYDVYDWRILREDIRLAPSSGTQQHKLAIGGIKVGQDAGPDGRPNGVIPSLESVPAAAGYTNDSIAAEAKADNLVVVDLETGGIVMERLTSDSTPPTPAANPLLVVNKNSGVVTFRDSDGNASNGTTGQILLPDKSIREVMLENRALRILYRTKNEFAVQVLKAAARYTTAPTAAVGAGQYYVGASNGNGIPTRIYFPRMDAGRKVSLGEINYVDGGGQTRQILGQDFVIRFNPDASLPLPSIDITEVDPAATGFSYGNGSAVRDVRGASVAVRVLWNPDMFTLTNDDGANMRSIDKFGQSWRRSTTETYLQKGEAAN